MRVISAFCGLGLALLGNAALAQSATPGPGLPDPANSPTAGDHYRDSGRPSPGRRSATPPPGLPDPANSPTVDNERDNANRSRHNRRNGFGGPVFGAPGNRPSDAPFAPQAEDVQRRPPAVYYGGQSDRRRDGFAEPDFAKDRRDSR